MMRILFHILRQLLWRFSGGLLLHQLVRYVLDVMSTGLSRSSSAGGAHYIDTDDIYNGHLVPRGTMVLANQWLGLMCLPSIPVRQLIFR